MCQVAAQEATTRSPFHVYRRPAAINRCGLAGFIVSLVGLVFTLGVLCPLGLLLSFVGLFSPNRGFAIAGLILGSVGSAIAGVALATIALATSTVHHYSVEVPQIQATHAVLEEALVEVQEYRHAEGRLPEGIAGNKLVLDHEDAWGNSVRYDLEDDGQFAIRSAGQDGQFDTSDDQVLSSNHPQQETDDLEIRLW